MMKKNFFYISLFSILSAYAYKEKHPKILVLIIASDQFEVYRELQNIWRSYMHLDPEHIEAYFIKGDENIPSVTMVQDDIIWSKTSDGWIPASAGILNKTILSLEMMMPRMHEFDYVLRTNLSSFYVFPRLVEFLRTLPKKQCYCGSHIGDGRTGSGCGFIISSDVAELLVYNKHQFLNVTHVEDDIAIGDFLNANGIGLLPQERMDFYSLADWHNKGPIANDIFQFRIKNPHELRLAHDIFIHKELFKLFYGNY